MAACDRGPWAARGRPAGWAGSCREGRWDPRLHGGSGTRKETKSVPIPFVFAKSRAGRHILAWIPADTPAGQQLCTRPHTTVNRAAFLWTESAVALVPVFKMNPPTLQLSLRVALHASLQLYSRKAEGPEYVSKH